MSGSPCLFVSVESSNLSNFIADFLANVLVNPYGDFSVDVSSNFAVDPMPSPAEPSFFDLSVFG